MNKAALLIAMRELSGGLKGFWVYLACIALGVFAIAASGTVTEGFSRGLDGQSRVLLGGDARFSASQRRATPDELAWMDELGTVSESVSLDVMGEAGAERRRVDLRGVDANHPLVGAPILSGTELGIQDIISQKNGVWGAAVSPSMLERFKIDIGDRITFGPIEFEVRAQLDQESDGLGEPGSFSPAATVSISALEEASQLTPGAFFDSRYRVALDDPTQTYDIEELAEEQWGEDGLRYRSPKEAVDDLKDLLGALDSFLVVIGIASLIAGGVGVAQASEAFLETRSGSIAAFKSLGASSATIRSAYLVQLGLIALIGAGLGSALGAITPFALDAIFGDQIPLPNVLSFYPEPILRAVALGLLTAALFAFPALGRARATTPAALFRTVGNSDKARTPRLELVLAALAGVGLFLLAIFSSNSMIVTGAFLVTSSIAWLLLKLFGVLMRLGAAQLAKNQLGMRRLMLSNLGGRGSLAPTIAPALGLGLGLLVAVVATQANIQRQISQTAAANLPALVFTQLPESKSAAFDQLLIDFGVDIDDPDVYRRAANIQGRIITLKGEEATTENVNGEEWAIREEITMPYIAKQPPEVDIVKGAWWPEDYDGPLLVSLEDDLAEGLGLDIGDEMGLRIFGRDLTATVTSLREVDWGGFGANFAVILSPGTLEDADPPNFAFAQLPPEQEAPVINALSDGFSEVVVFQTRDILETASKLLAGIGTAVNAAAAIVLFAGLLVLFGAFAAMARARRAEAALLKTLGATRGTILRLYAGEFAIVAGTVAILCSVAGTAGASWLVTRQFEASWHIPWIEVTSIAGAAILVSAIGGALVGVATLATPPARVLRQG